MDWKLEVIVVPVTDIDRAKQFYLDKIGFKLDADTQPAENFRVVHMTPPGSACSVVVGPAVVSPGTNLDASARMQLVVTDIDAARAELSGRGVDVSDVQVLDHAGRREVLLLHRPGREQLGRAGGPRVRRRPAGLRRGGSGRRSARMVSDPSGDFPAAGWSVLTGPAAAAGVRAGEQGTAMTVSTDFISETGQFRTELLAYCYRMLGSADEAEDLVQETYLRAWRSYAGFEGRSSVRTWLYRIATNACLTAIDRRGRRPLPSGLGAPGDDPAAPVPGRAAGGALAAAHARDAAGRPDGRGGRPGHGGRCRGRACGWPWSPPGSTCPPGSARC